MSFGALDLRARCCSPRHAASNRASLARLFAAIAMINCDRTRINGTIHSLCHITHGFQPSERLFDLLLVVLKQGITLMLDGLAIDC
jgi:hypothetical protein